jgi:hypothetical protein
MLTWGQIFWCLWDWLKGLFIAAIIVGLGILFYKKLVTPITTPFFEERFGKTGLPQKNVRQDSLP